MNISPARTAAFDILIRVEKDGAFSSALLPQFEETLSEKDSSLCHELTLGVLRRKLYLDAVIDKLSKGKRIDLEIRVAIWLGLFQLIFLDRVPAHAAIDESVNLALRAKKRSAKGFVNAILRSFQREPFVPHSDDQIEELSISTSHPRWLIERWVEQFGIDEARKLCEANNERPSIAFRVIDKDGAENLESLLMQGSVRRSEFVDGAFISAGEIPDGIYFQDEGSQLVAQSVIADTDSLILDVCAAPGGKTAMIAAKTRRVVAGDVHWNRVELLRSTCENLNATNVRIVQYDARESLPFENGTFDVVFVDAPCSGTGTIRHNPEIRYSISGVDIIELSDKQRRILQNASDLVREGGKLIYSTCSLEREENEMVCADFERSNPHFIKTTPSVPDRFLTVDGFARTWPSRDEMDGFFIAVYGRK
jgi:16S rRNA (cytosine967-C5)-methyltransferase